MTAEKSQPAPVVDQDRLQCIANAVAALHDLCMGVGQAEGVSSLLRLIMGADDSICAAEALIAVQSLLDRQGGAPEHAPLPITTMDFGAALRVIFFALIRAAQINLPDVAPQGTAS